MRFTDEQNAGDRDEISTIRGELKSSGRQTAAIHERLRQAHHELRRIVGVGSASGDRE